MTKSSSPVAAAKAAGAHASLTAGAKMAANTKPGPDAPLTGAAPLAVAPGAGAPRRRISSHEDSHAVQTQNIAALQPHQVIVGSGKDDDMVKVNVTKPFKLMDDHRHIHHYDQIGKQEMPRSHALAPYAKANGVIIEDDSVKQDEEEGDEE